MGLKGFNDGSRNYRYDWEGLENRPPLYTKDEVDSKLSEKADKSNTYTKSEVDGKVASAGNFDSTQYYNKTESDGRFQPKGNYLTEHQDISDKTEKRLLSYDGSSITLGGVTQTYSMLYDYCMNQPDFVVLVHENKAYHVNTVSNEQIVFISSYTASGYVQIDRISISSADAITKTSGKSEMLSNKVNSISDSNKTSTDKYPSVKAVADIVATKADAGASYTKAEVDAKFTESSEEITNLQSGKADKSDTYTKSEVDAKVAQGGSFDATQYYNKSASDARFQPKGNYLTEHQDISGKADKSDTYTKAEVDEKVASGGTFDPTNYYTKAEVDTEVGKKYTKPSTGIPKTDLASDVQASLEKADSALQNVPSDYAKKSDIPTSLKNPNALTFTGAVTGSYDGSEALSIEIPQGGSGGTSSKYEWEVVRELSELSEDVSMLEFTGLDCDEIYITGMFRCNDDDNTITGGTTKDFVVTINNTYTTIARIPIYCSFSRYPIDIHINSHSGIITSLDSTTMSDTSYAMRTAITAHPAFAWSANMVSRGRINKVYIKPEYSGYVLKSDCKFLVLKRG